MPISTQPEEVRFRTDGAKCGLQFMARKRFFKELMRSINLTLTNLPPAGYNDGG